jgi:hypothetical protein
VCRFLSKDKGCANRDGGFAIAIRIETAQRLVAAHVTILPRVPRLFKAVLMAASRNFLSLAGVRDFS